MKRKNTYRTSLGILIIGVLVIAGALAVLFRSPAETPAKDATSSVISEGSVAQTDPAHGSDSGRNEASSEVPESSSYEEEAEKESSPESTEESSGESSFEESSSEESSKEESSSKGSSPEESSEAPAKEESSKEEEQAQSDDWKMILVNRWNPIPDGYTFETFELRNGQAVDKRIYEDLQAMFDAARAEGIYPYIVESYRTHEDQVAMMDYYIGIYESEGASEEEAREKAEAVVAIPGTSEHELGLAVDINGEYTDTQESAVVWDWLMNHCYEYGFILRYPEDKTEITGIDYEPWHYRYVGRENAQKIQESGQCLEEYLGRTEHE